MALDYFRQCFEIGRPHSRQDGPLRQQVAEEQIDDAEGQRVAAIKIVVDGRRRDTELLRDAYDRDVLQRLRFRQRQPGRQNDVAVERPAAPRPRTPPCARMAFSPRRSPEYLVARTPPPPNRAGVVAIRRGVYLFDTTSDMPGMVEL